MPASIRDLLRKSGLRCTPGRMSVLRILFDAGRPMSHGQLAEMLMAKEMNPGAPPLTGSFP